MGDPLVLSGSSVNTYGLCPKRWYYEYVVVDVRPNSLSMARGLAAHEALEFYLQAKVDGDTLPVLKDLLDRYIVSFEREAKESPEGPRETRKDVFDRGKLAVEAWYTDVAPTVEPVLVEIGGQFTVNGVYYSWTADLFDKDGIVRDWKFVKSKPSDTPFFDYTNAMAGYIEGITSEGYQVGGAQLDYMVCTLNPYHLPKPISPDRDEFGFTVKNTHDQIKQGRFPATDDRRTCSWCPYSDGTCPEGSAWRRVSPLRQQ